MTRFGRIAVAVLAPLLLASCGSADLPDELLSLGANGEDTPVEAAVTCPAEEDLIVTGVFEYEPRDQGRSTPEAAVHRHIQEDYPGVESSEARKRGGTASGAVRFEVSRGGFRQLVLDAVDDGSAWRVVYTAACEAFQQRTGRKL